MNAYLRSATLLALTLGLGGCATYPYNQDVLYADGSYYSPAAAGNGDYYYASVVPSYQHYSYYGYTGYCSVLYSSCASWPYYSYYPYYHRPGAVIYYDYYAPYYYAPSHYRRAYRSYPNNSARTYRSSAMPNSASTTKTTAPASTASNSDTQALAQPPQPSANSQPTTTSRKMHQPQRQIIREQIKGRAGTRHSPLLD